MGKAVTKASRARAKERVERVANKRPRERKPLPATFMGQNVLRGEPLRAGVLDLDGFIEKHALLDLAGVPEVFLVVEDGAFEDLDGSTQIYAFTDPKIALAVAKARSCGNVNHRVLRVVEQTLVVATDNDL